LDPIPISGWGSGLQLQDNDLAAISGEAAKIPLPHGRWPAAQVSTNAVLN
jgi:hypothetical protein